MPSRLSWAALLGLVASAGGCSSTSAGPCTTDELPKNDPCYMKRCCDSVQVPFDAGPEAGADAGTVTRICGACNG